MSELALKLIKEAKEKRLTRLDLGNCGLTELPDELFELVWLEELNLSNEGAFWNSEKAKYEKFISKNKGKRNIINILSPKFEQLKNLKILLINGIKDYNQEIEIRWNFNNLEPLKYLYHLQHLDISTTNVNDISCLENLVNLRACLKI